MKTDPVWGLEIMKNQVISRIWTIKNNIQHEWRYFKSIILLQIEQENSLFSKNNLALMNHFCLVTYKYNENFCNRYKKKTLSRGRCHRIITHLPIGLDTALFSKLEHYVYCSNKTLLWSVVFARLLLQKNVMRILYCWEQPNG